MYPHRISTNDLFFRAVELLLPHVVLHTSVHYAAILLHRDEDAGKSSNEVDESSKNFSG